jgi:predicted transcriptional regulator
MLILLKSPKSLAELKTEIGKRETTILHTIKDLEVLNLTTKYGKTYALTSLGRMEALILEETSSAIKVVEKFKDFWHLHDITAIPNHFLQSIGALKNSILIRTETLELSKVHKTFLKILMTSKRIRGTSPIFHPDYVKTFKNLLHQGASVELILTSVVFNKILALADPELLIDYIKEERLKIFLNDDLRIALTVTENTFSLGLFNVDGEYDYNMDLISYSPKALEWGNDCFQHYIKKARIMGLETLNLC